MGSMNIFVTVLVSVVVVGALVAGLRVTGGRGPSKVRAGQPACDVERGLGRRRWRLRRLVVGGDSGSDGSGGHSCGGGSSCGGGGGGCGGVAADRAAAARSPEVTRHLAPGG